MNWLNRLRARFYVWRIERIVKRAMPHEFRRGWRLELRQ